MSDKVRGYFPQAPEMCVNCPALEAAAERLDFYFSVTRETSVTDENPANPVVSGEDYLASLLGEENVRRAEVARFMTDKTVDQHMAITGVAQDLYENCNYGAYYKSQTRQVGILRLSKVIAITRACQSTARLANFIPVLYTEHKR